MDLVFNALPDVFSYQSFRHTTYDAPWLNDVNTNKARRSSDSRGQGQTQLHPPSGSSCTGASSSRGERRGSCPLCQEKQRRPLATYIRSKSRQDRREESSIQEEEEEEDDAEEEAAAVTAQAQAQAQAPAHANPASAAAAAIENSQ